MNISDAVKEYILENYLFTDDKAALGDDESFMERGIVDSTGMMEVIAFIEQEFGIQVADAEMVPENLDSVAAIAAFVQRKRGDELQSQTAS